MLPKTVVEVGNDWGRLLPYLLFAYSEVPQASLVFRISNWFMGSKFVVPWDILKEMWEASKQSSESVVSYVLTIL